MRSAGCPPAADWPLALQTLMMAVRVLDRPGGPDSSTFDVLPLKGVDPVVTLAQLEAIMTGCSYDEAAARPRSGQLLSSPDADSAFVVSVSDTLQEALATPSHDSLIGTAASWSGTTRAVPSLPTSRGVGLDRLCSGLACPGGRSRGTRSPTRTRDFAALRPAEQFDGAE